MHRRHDSDTKAFLAALGRAVAARRERLRLSQEEVGLSSDLGQAYVSRVEGGLRNPTVNSLLALAAALETTASKLIASAERQLRRSDSS